MSHLSKNWEFVQVYFWTAVQQVWVRMVEPSTLEVVQEKWADCVASIARHWISPNLSYPIFVKVETAAWTKQLWLCAQEMGLEEGMWFFPNREILKCHYWIFPKVVQAIMRFLTLKNLKTNRSLCFHRFTIAQQIFHFALRKALGKRELERF